MNADEPKSGRHSSMGSVNGIPYYARLDTYILDVKRGTTDLIVFWQPEGGWCARDARHA